MFVPIIVSSTRHQSNGLKVGNAIKKLISDLNPKIKTAVITPADFNISYDGKKDPKYTEIINKSHSIILVVSEYNHGYPGALKTLLDSEFEAYSQKFVLLVGVSNGVFGGARALENILPVLRALNLRVTNHDILFREAQNKVNEKGEFLDFAQKEKAIDALREFFKEST